MKNVTNNVWSFTTVKLQAKRLCLLAAFTAVIVFTMTAATCGTKSGGGGSASGAGQLTINGLEEFNGNWISGMSYDAISASDDLWLGIGIVEDNVGYPSSMLGAIQISGGKVTLPVYDYYGKTTIRPTDPYIGNDTVEIMIQIYTTQDKNTLAGGKFVAIFTITANFTNGKATVTYEP